MPQILLQILRPNSGFMKSTILTGTPLRLEDFEPSAKAGNTAIQGPLRDAETRAVEPQDCSALLGICCGMIL